MDAEVEAFLTAYKKDDNHFWRTSSGEHQCVVDELCDALVAAQAARDGFADLLGEVMEARDALQTERDEYKEAFEANNAEIDALQAIPTVYLHNLPPTWQEGDPEPPSEIHVMGTPECVAGLIAVIAERDRLASQVAALNSDKAMSRVAMIVAREWCIFMNENRGLEDVMTSEEIEDAHKLVSGWMKKAWPAARLTPTEEPPPGTVACPPARTGNRRATSS